jgi:hypothetical protein
MSRYCQRSWMVRTPDLVPVRLACSCVVSLCTRTSSKLGGSGIVPCSRAALLLHTYCLLPERA